MDLDLRSGKVLETKAQSLPPELAAPEIALRRRALPSRARFVSLITERDGRVVGVRLVQAGPHERAAALFAKLGFVVREALACIQGSALGLVPRGLVVRAVVESDIESCGRLCRRIHGHARDGELREAVAQGTAALVERDRRVTGYATSIGFLGHAVAESNKDLQALIGAAGAFAGPGFLVPTRNIGLLHWCLEHDLRIVRPLTLMTRGAYREPAGAFLPSILY
jgi:hypothetical protein